MQKIISVILFVFISSAAQSQTSDTIYKPGFDKSVCLLTGINYSKQLFIDLGVSVNKSGSVGYHPFASAYFLASEFHFAEKPVIGPKIGGWIAGGVAAMTMGVNLIYYTDFSQESLVFRPEVGIGLDRFKIVYGYNARLTNTSFDRISKHCFGIVYCFRLKRLSKDQKLEAKS